MKTMQWMCWVFLLSFQLHAAENNLFKSEIAGFEVTKPAHWQFVTVEQDLENVKTVVQGLKGSKVSLKRTTAPLVAMMKYPEPYDKLNPTFKVTLNPMDDLKKADPKKILLSLLPQFQKIFPDFQLIQAPTMVKVAGIKSGYMRMNYSLQAPDGTMFPATSELWVIPRRNYLFMIGAGTEQDDEGADSKKEVEQILHSIKIMS